MSCSTTPTRVTNVSHLPHMCHNVSPMSNQCATTVGQCVPRANDRHNGVCQWMCRCHSMCHFHRWPHSQVTRQGARWAPQATENSDPKVAAKVNPCMLVLQEVQERGEASREAKRRCRAKQGREKGKGRRGSDHPTCNHGPQVGQDHHATRSEMCQVTPIHPLCNNWE